MSPQGRAISPSDLAGASERTSSLFIRAVVATHLKITSKVSSCFGETQEAQDKEAALS